MARRPPGEILERLVAGTQKTADPQTAAAAALKALLQRPGQENEDLLFRVITAPEQSATTDRTAIDPNKLRSTALDVGQVVGVRGVSASAGPLHGRAGDAAGDLQSNMDQPERAARRESGRPNPLVPKRPTRPTASSSRSNASSRSKVGRCCVGCWDFLRPSSCSPQPAPRASIADPRRAAELLWGANFAAVVEQRLRAAEGSKRGSPLLSLACTIPCPAMRAAVLQSLEKYWEEGPKRFEPFDRLRRIGPGAGLSAVGEAIASQGRPGARPRRATPQATAAALPDRLPQRRPNWPRHAQVKDRQDKAAQQWLDFSEKLAQAMCRQLWAAAIAATRRRSHVPIGEGRLRPSPSNCQPNANVVASYHVEWPEGLDGALAGLPLAPLRVRYVRIEQKARPDRLLAYYRHQLPSANRARQRPRRLAR